MIMNVLIVDDNTTNRKLLSAVLQAEEMNTFEASDGRHALAILESEKVDAVISDILMPNMDGYQLCHRVRKSEKFGGLPFIHYTSTYTSPVDRKLSASVGADRYISKPAPSQLLIETLRELTTEAKTRAQRTAALSDDVVLMREYNVVLVRKLEERNEELEVMQGELLRTNQRLQARTDELARLNEHLEQRVRERTAELEAANRELEAFSYSVSHDLLAPLRSIDGFSRQLAEDCADTIGEAGQRLLQRVRAASRRMGQLIDALLTLSRVTRAELRRETVDLSLLGRIVAAELRQSEPQRQVEFVAAPGLTVAGDPHLLRAALENLLGNAWKFTRNTPGARVELGREARAGGTVYFVRDNGAGFDMAYADQLFSAFKQLNPGPEFAGHGIGLATVQRILARHGGRIWADSKPDQGATFFFAFE